jgi:hypothetical protein
VTLEQVEARQRKAANFARNVLEDDDLADSLEDEDPADYAERKHLKITNSGRRSAMANSDNAGNGDGFSSWTKADCVDALAQVAQIASDAYTPEASREDLAGALGDILNALSDDDGDEDEDDDEDDHGQD